VWAKGEIASFLFLGNSRQGLKRPALWCVSVTGRHSGQTVTQKLCSLCPRLTLAGVSVVKLYYNAGFP
jgi:hypothetical protein